MNKSRFFGENIFIYVRISYNNYNSLINTLKDYISGYILLHQCSYVRNCYTKEKVRTSLLDLRNK